jgi:hypothetical protein
VFENLDCGLFESTHWFVEPATKPYCSNKPARCNLCKNVKLYGFKWRNIWLRVQMTLIQRFPEMTVFKIFVEMHLNALKCHVFFCERTRRICCRFFFRKEPVIDLFNSRYTIDIVLLISREFSTLILIGFLLYVGFQNQNTVLHCRPTSYFRTIIFIFARSLLNWTNNSCRYVWKVIIWCYITEHASIMLQAACHPQPNDLADSVGSTLKCMLFVWDCIPHRSRTVFLAVLFFYLQFFMAGDYEAYLKH